MTKAKNEAIEEVKELLLKQQADITHKILQNRWSLKKLVEEQAKLKRERFVITELLWKLDGKKRTEK